MQYTAPFVSVHLPTMASAFNLDGRSACTLRLLARLRLFSSSGMASRHGARTSSRVQGCEHRI